MGPFHSCRPALVAPVHARRARVRYAHRATLRSGLGHHEIDQLPSRRGDLLRNRVGHKPAGKSTAAGGKPRALGRSSTAIDISSAGRGQCRLSTITGHSPTDQRECRLTPISGHQATVRSLPHFEQDRRGHGWLIQIKPARVVNGDVPHSGHRNSHNEAAPCASQKTAPGSAPATPQRAAGQNSQSGEAIRTNRVQAMNSHALR